MSQSPEQSSKQGQEIREDEEIAEESKDLDIDPEEAAKVSGGLMRRGDPCDGGE